jgi:hypothetical protein
MRAGRGRVSRKCSVAVLAFFSQGAGHRAVHAVDELETVPDRVSLGPFFTVFVYLAFHRF